MHEDEAHAEQADLLDLSEVMQAFGIASWNNLGPLEASHSEVFQTQVEIEGRRYLLQERPSGLATQEYTHLYAFRDYLAQAGIPLAALRLTTEGSPFVTLGEDTFELQEWIDGALFDSHDEHEHSWIASAGEMLARLHQASRRYPGPIYRWPSELQAGGLTSGWLNFARSKIEQSEVYALTTALSHLVEAWEAALPAAMMAIGTGRNLPEFHIHGDYSALHLRFSPHGVNQVLGLDASRWEKRLLEVAYGVFYFAGLSWDSSTNLTRPLVKRGIDPQRAALFLRHYADIYPSVPGESALLVDALALVAPIITANGPLEDIFYGSLDPEEILIDDALERLAWATSLPVWLNRVRRSFAEMW